MGIAVKERKQHEKKVEGIISSSMAGDEMDKLISLKSAFVGCLCAGIAFIAALAALALGRRIGMVSLGNEIICQILFSVHP
jgi:Asp/Glu/hydantoin racemase